MRAKQYRIFLYPLSRRWGLCSYAQNHIRYPLVHLENIMIHDRKPASALVGGRLTDENHHQFVSKRHNLIPHHRGIAVATVVLEILHILRRISPEAFRLFYSLSFLALVYGPTRAVRMVEAQSKSYHQSIRGCTYMAGLGVGNE